MNSQPACKNYRKENVESAHMVCAGLRPMLRKETKCVVSHMGDGNE